MGFWADFELGVAGISDAIFGGEAAARKFAEQTAEENGLSPEEREELERRAREAERTEDVLRRAADETVGDVGRAVAETARGVLGFGSLLLVAVVVAGAAYVARALKGMR